MSDFLRNVQEAMPSSRLAADGHPLDKMPRWRMTRQLRTTLTLPQTNPVLCRPRGNHFFTYFGPLVFSS